MEHDQHTTSTTTQRPMTNLPATLPIPGNAEFLVYALILIVFAIIAAASDTIGAGEWVIAATVLTAAYLLSRGIAKASRVYEQ